MPDHDLNSLITNIYWGIENGDTDEVYDNLRKIVEGVCGGTLAIPERDRFRSGLDLQ